MRILIISRGVPSKRYPQWGCFEKDQAETLAKIGHEVIVVSFDGRFKLFRGHPGLHKTTNNGVIYFNFVALPESIFHKTIGFFTYWNKYKIPVYQRIINKIIKKYWKPDIIYSHFFWCTAIGTRIKENFNIPLVGIEHWSKFNENTISSTNDSLARIAFNGVDKLISVSQPLSNNLKKKYGVESTVIHNMFGPEFGLSKNPISFEKSPSTLRFISTASLIKRKGFDMLIDAMKKVNSPKEKWQLDIIGDGEERAALQQQIEDAGLQDRIHLLGRMNKEKIVGELKKSHVFVLPSRNENFSVAVLEALSLGLPVIATICGGIRECINENNGLLVPVDDSDAMAAAIDEMIANYNSYDRLGIAKSCEEQFSPEAIAKELTKVFESVVKKG